ncbi:DUF3685 domain-containing protein [Spirulina subsalsa FACHB-351]|uniref:DUF3685 domain-containing protein n=1 Tax=Spirulina subsalsa FACHB-351 TaxID=234711 RepID=A0ABT3L8Y1_9CYAN|nr:DUF3685 domain-containing protein [Spirulina subsalsa]MCW6037966.1 DUF3685 domain-containing protein [Spirulina subsalsa FACHB-351]
MTDSQIALLLIDPDPIFRLGLATALASEADLEVRGQLDPAQGLDALRDLLAPNPDASEQVWVIVFDLSLEGGREVSDGLNLLSQQQQAATLFLSSYQDSQLLQTLQQQGISGYLPKGSAIAEITNTIRQLATGAPHWPNLPPEPPALSSPQTPQTPPRWLYNLRSSGLKQIENALNQVSQQLNRENLPSLDWLFWQGRQRELKTARWLVNQLLPVEVVIQPSLPPDSPQPPDPYPIPLNEAPGALTPAPSLLDQFLQKLAFGLQNSTAICLELEILRREKQQELLYRVVKQLEAILEDLELLKVTPDELANQQSLILRELWQKSALAFLSPYISEWNNRPLFDCIVQNTPPIEENCLSQIPLSLDLLNYLLFESPLFIENVPYRPESPEAKTRASQLLDHLILQVANGVIQFVLNQFAELENLKYTLYERQFLSSREIARFRNNLSWRYRQDRYLENPKAIFESQYRLYTLDRGQLRITPIYAPRLQELEQLEGIPWLVTIVLEGRDALAPRVRAVVSFLGSGVVYVLTQVIGKGIGLIGRGMIQGLGNVVQETRYRRERMRE